MNALRLGLRPSDVGGSFAAALRHEEACWTHDRVFGTDRHLERVEVRYAAWDLTVVHLADERTGKVLCRFYPQDKTRNASGERRALE
ncbi:MAG: hypothetical protein ACXVHJ_37105, partial [Solirubrobacteraceae bacterium]